jgi:hypothetical protein
LASLKDLPTLRELEDLVAPATDDGSEVEEVVAEVSQPEEVAALEADVPEVLH